MLTAESEPEAEIKGEGAAFVASIDPEISKSLAELTSRSNKYHGPLAAEAPVFTKRRVTVVPEGTFCSAAMPDKSIIPADAPTLVLI